MVAALIALLAFDGLIVMCVVILSGAVSKDDKRQFEEGLSDNSCNEKAPSCYPSQYRRCGDVRIRGRRVRTIVGSNGFSMRAERRSGPPTEKHLARGCW